MPVGAKFLTLEFRGGRPFVYFEVNDSARLEDREFVFVGVGHEIPASGVYLGAAIEQNFVWHLYEIK